MAATFKDETEVVLARSDCQEVNDNLERIVQARTAQLEAPIASSRRSAIRCRTTCARRCAAIDGFSRLLLDDCAPITRTPRRRLSRIRSATRTWAS